MNHVCVGLGQHKEWMVPSSKRQMLLSISMVRLYKIASKVIKYSKENSDNKMITSPEHILKMIQSILRRFPCVTGAVQTEQGSMVNR